MHRLALLFTLTASFFAAVALQPDEMMALQDGALAGAAGASSFQLPTPRIDVPPGGRLHPQIQLASPLPGEDAESPLEVVGRARGPWYFEADFSIRLYGPDGRELAVAVAQAQAPWMTEDWVPFRAELEFDAPREACLTMVLEKANPSGLPEHDDRVMVGLRCVLEK